QKGQGIKKIANKNDFIEFFKNNPQCYLIQEFLKIDGDIRVLVVGKKILGAIKRTVLKNDFRSNVSLGAKIKKIELTTIMKKVALKATELMGYEIAGVDLIEYNNKIYVLEVNSTPEWQGFKKVTGINPAKEIINYAIKKYEKI
ncbi:MAG TPA: ATP-grasp domain-containing protein, partial [Candidatus Moranbacteria bacterium]|nr:ATP-grasp domain-containing protein [Candidatus Moranbacteria bacterium]